MSEEIVVQAEPSEVVVPSVVPTQPGRHLPKPTIDEMEALNKAMQAESAAAEASKLPSAEIEAKLQKMSDEGIKILSMSEFTPEKAGINTKGFIPVGSDLPKGFAIQNTHYVIYDYDLCAPWGLLQGHLLSFETWVEGGNSQHAAIFLPSKPFMVLERSIVGQADGTILMQVTPRRVMSQDLVMVRLFESPERLRKYVTQAWVTEMQVRAGSPPPQRNWIFATSEEQKTRASLNLV